MLFEIFFVCRIRDIDLKTPARPPAFAFVSFESSYDAEDAIRGRGELLIVCFLAPSAAQNAHAVTDTAKNFFRCTRILSMLK